MLLLLKTKFGGIRYSNLLPNPFVHHRLLFYPYPPAITPETPVIIDF